MRVKKPDELSHGLFRSIRTRWAKWHTVSGVRAVMVQRQSPSAPADRAMNLNEGCRRAVRDDEALCARPLLLYMEAEDPWHRRKDMSREKRGPCGCHDRHDQEST